MTDYSDQRIPAKVVGNVVATILIIGFVLLLAAILTSCSTETDAQKLARLQHEKYLALAYVLDYRYRGVSDSLLLAERKYNQANAKYEAFIAGR